MGLNGLNQCGVCLNDGYGVVIHREIEPSKCPDVDESVAVTRALGDPEDCSGRVALTRAVAGFVILGAVKSAGVSLRHCQGPNGKLTYSFPVSIHYLELALCSHFLKRGTLAEDLCSRHDTNLGALLPHHGRKGGVLPPPQEREL